MDTWVIVLIALLVVMIIFVVSFVIYKSSKNTAINKNNILIPFSGAITPGDSTVFLKNSSGTSQIDCTQFGGKVNIVGAWVEVIDPYGECSGDTADALNITCGIRTSKIPCRQDSDCGNGMNCSGGLCTPGLCPIKSGNTFDSSACSCGGNYCPIRPGPNNCKSNSDCNDPQGIMMTCDTSSGSCVVNPGQTCVAPDPYSGQFCSLYPLCSNSTKLADGTGMVNNVCNPKGTCRPRDASAYLSGLCDGNESCNVLFDPTNRKNGFGPIPCDGSVMPGNTNYSRLPNIPGQAGTFSQGYYVHGLYTCI